MFLLKAVFLFVRGILSEKARIAIEKLALRQQLAVLHKNMARPRIRNRDRIFWVGLSNLWLNWRSALIIVKPDTVIRWHQMGFRLFWRWKSRRRKTGRPKIEQEIRALIRRMCRENPIWGAPRIQAELKLLGYDVAESTVGKYMVRGSNPPSQTWRTFLKNHAGDIAAIDFFTVPTVSFRILYCFVVLLHHRRHIAHFNVTQHPTAQWTSQQIIETFPNDEAPRYLLRDRDSTYGEFFCRRIKHMGIEEITIAARSPWQTPYVERLIGSIRRECLDHMIILNDNHLRRILSSYFDYYHYSRTHLSLDRNSPCPREVDPPEGGKVIAIPKVGGLHNHYKRAA
ncbi:integrase core domain-containing protein [Acidobacteriota bacterium]